MIESEWPGGGVVGVDGAGEWVVLWVRVGYRVAVREIITGIREIGTILNWDIKITPFQKGNCRVWCAFFGKLTTCFYLSLQLLNIIFSTQDTLPVDYGTLPSSLHRSNRETLLHNDVRVVYRTSIKCCSTSS